MSGYLLSIVGTVLLYAILTAIIPDGKTSAMIKNVAKLACLLVIVSPLLGIFQSFSRGKDSGGKNKGNVFDENRESFFLETVIQTDEDFIKYYCNMRIENAETALERELENEYALCGNVELSWRYEGNNELFEADKMKITNIYIQTKKEMSEEEKKIVWDYLTKNYCSEVLIE